MAQVRPLPRRPHLYRVDLEGLGSFRLDADTVRALGLTGGAEVSAELVAQIAGAAVRQRARAAALRLLERRLRSRAELIAALRRRGFDRETIVAVMTELHRAGWIDDARFARAWVRDRMALRPSGPRRLRAELLARGVAPAIVAEAIAAELPEGAEEALALEQARGRLRRLQGLPPDVARRRLGMWLQRRGFAPDVIAHTVLVLMGRAGSSDADPAA
ncbi:MAG: regulatory protein RecX [Armatimonadota bacterium]|nr:regulatory protein RecX [Armatimonadota bacterium]